MYSISPSAALSSSLPRSSMPPCVSNGFPDVVYGELDVGCLVCRQGVSVCEAGSMLEPKNMIRFTTENDVSDKHQFS